MLRPNEYKPGQRVCSDYVWDRKIPIKGTFVRVYDDWMCVVRWDVPGFPANDRGESFPHYEDIRPLNVLDELAEML